MLTESEKERIVSAIQERVPELQCPMCHHDQFILIDGYITNTLQDNLSKIKIGGSTVPLVAIACQKCGHVSLHSAGLLGLLPKKGNAAPSVADHTNDKQSE